MRGSGGVRGRTAARGTPPPPPPEAAIRGDGDGERVGARGGGGGGGAGGGGGGGGAERRASKSRPERRSKNGRHILSASPSATARLAVSSGSRRLGGIAPALAAHLGVGSGGIGDFGLGLTAAPQPPIWPWAAQLLAPSAWRGQEPGESQTQEARGSKLWRDQEATCNLLARSKAAAAGAKSRSARSCMIRGAMKPALLGLTGPSSALEPRELPCASARRLEPQLAWPSSAAARTTGMAKLEFHGACVALQWVVAQVVGQRRHREQVAEVGEEGPTSHVEV